MPSEMDGARWRFRIAHDCDNTVLRGAAIRRMLELKRDANGQVRIEHRQEKEAGIDVVTVVWMNQRITIVVAFHQGQALVGVQVPLVLQLLRNAAETRVYREIRRLVADAGGNVSDIQQVA